MKIPEQPERSPAGEGVSRGRNYTSSWLGRLVGGGTIEDYAMFPPPPGASEEAVDQARRLWGYVDEWQKEGIIDGDLLAFRYGNTENFWKDLYLHWGEWQDILMSVFSPRISDYSVAHLRDDENDSRLAKRIPMGISAADGSFLDISLAGARDPHSLVFIGKEALGADFLRGIAYFANEIDTIPGGKKADKIALFLLADPSQYGNLYREFTGLPIYHSRKRKDHWSTPSHLFTATRLALMDHMRDVQTSVYTPQTTSPYAIVMIPGLDTLIRRMPKFVNDTIVTLLRERDPRIRVFATMGHAQEAIDLHMGKTPVFFDGGFYGTTPPDFHLPNMRALDNVLYELPPRQFALPDGKTYWVPRIQ